MLNDEVIDKVIERLVNRIESANTYVLREISKRVKRIGTISATDRHQLVQMLKYGGDFDKILKELARLTNLNVYDIYEIFDEVAKSDYEFAKHFYDYRDIKYIPYSKNLELQAQVRALATITAQEYMNIANTTLLGFGFQDASGNVTYKGLKETYYDLLDEAVLSISQGKETFENAMARQLTSIGESGLKVIYPTTYVDKNGVVKHHTRRLDSATRMNMVTALSNLHNEMQQQIGDDIGADGWEISVHEFPAEDHQEAQGRQFSKEEFDKLQTTGVAKTYQGKIIDMHNGEFFRPISDYNCKHFEFAIILGVDNPAYSEKQLQEIRDRNDKGFYLFDKKLGDYKHYTMYEGTQLQRRIETEIRTQKDIEMMAKESNNEEMLANAHKKITALKHKYKELSDASGLKRKSARLRV